MMKQNPTNKSLKQMIENLKLIKDDVTFEQKASEMIEEIWKSDLSVEQKVVYQGEISQIRSQRNQKVMKIKNYNIAQRFFMKHPKIASIAGIAAISLGLGGVSVSLIGCGNKDADKEVVVDTTPDLDVSGNDAVKQQNVLPPTLWFDANDNDALIQQSAQFIANSRACGIDFASPEEINKYMDFYLVANLEQIDPMDYARLNYYYKTSQSIMDNYQECINEISYDLLTVTPDTMLSYDFIADKDSKEVLNEIQELVAQYNVAETNSQKKEIAQKLEDLFMEKFVTTDGRTYTRATYEMAARFSLIVDEILPRGLSEDITSILSEDLYDCDRDAPAGEKEKSERAQAETSIREMLEEKLTIVREYRNQDLTNVSASELLTGVEVEAEILSLVQEMNIEFIENPSLEEAKEQTTTQSSTQNTVTLDNGEVIAEEDITELGLDPENVTADTYEEAVEEKFEQQAQQDPNHTIRDKNGNVVVSGGEVNSEEYNKGFADGYAAGNSYASCNPSGSASYVAGYKAGHAMGLADRKAVDNQTSNSNTHFESTNEQVVESNENIVEQGYTGTPNVPTPTPTPTPEPENPDIEENTEFVPVGDGNGVVIESTEEVTEEDYLEITTTFEPIASARQSQINELYALREAVLTIPTVTYDSNGDAVLSMDGYQYELTEHSMRA